MNFQTRNRKKKFKLYGIGGYYAVRVGFLCYGPLRVPLRHALMYFAGAFVARGLRQA